MKNVLLTILLLGGLMLLWTGCDDLSSNNLTDSEDDVSSDSLTDSRDGEIYATVKINNQIWMAENLRYDTLGSWSNPDNPSAIYGRLYSWTIAQTACPNGWHLPSDAEWSTLEVALGMNPSDSTTTVYGYRDTHGTGMKSTTGWSRGNGTNTSGFNVFPAGNHISNGYSGWGNYAYFWSSTELGGTKTWARYLGCGSAGVFRDLFDSTHKSFGFSCRCIKD
ncbi:MAG: hypothetical protein GY810_15630 [Aureispira sp.]|nr:hypothetical protein [Aureispira sp.]